jgi:O-antigen/teichoic acid export membrane protein
VSLTALANALLPGFLRPYWERVKESPLGLRLARGVFWSFVGAALSRSLGLASSVLTARILGKESFGELGMLLGTISMFGIFAGFGLGVTATKYLAEMRGKDHAQAGRILALTVNACGITAGAASLALVLLAPWLAETSLAAPHLAPYLRLSAALVFLNAMVGALTGALAGFEAFRTLAWLSAVGGLLNFPFVVLGTWFYGLEGAVGGMVGSALLSLGFFLWAVRREAAKAGIPWSATGCWRERGVLWAFSLPTFAANGITIPVLWYGQTLLARTEGGYAAVADFSVGQQWRGLVLFLSSITLAGYLPVMSSVKAEEVSTRRKLLWAHMIPSLVLTGLLVTVPLVFSEFIASVYGKSFESASWVLRIVMLQVVFEAVNNILVPTLLASGGAWLRLISNSIWSVVTMILCVMWIPRWNALGLAGAVCVAQGVHLAIQAILVRHCLNRSLRTT